MIGQSDAGEPTASRWAGRRSSAPNARWWRRALWTRNRAGPARSTN